MLLMMTMITMMMAYDDYNKCVLISDATFEGFLKPLNLTLYFLSDMS